MKCAPAAIPSSASTRNAPRPGGRALDAYLRERHAGALEASGEARRHLVGPEVRAQLEAEPGEQVEEPAVVLAAGRERHVAQVDPARPDFFKV